MKKFQESFVPRESLGRKAVKSASDINLVLGETPRILELDINRVLISQNQIAYESIFVRLKHS